MSKINKSWEKSRVEVHSPKGVRDLRDKVRFGLRKKYIGIAESMWEYPGMDDEKFSDMTSMSRDTVPEVHLMKQGTCVWFHDDLTEQIHCLPVVMKGGLNMYGKPNAWSPMPIGYDAHKPNPDAVERIASMTLSAENSVVMMNDLFGGNDEGYINAMIDELVDNTLTMNQLQLLAKSPFVFNVSEDNLLSAKNFFLAICEDRPAIFTNSMGDKPSPTTEKIDSKIDPALFELYDRFECQLLEYIGFPCVPITKRAQQSVSEVQSNDMKIYMRRYEKWNQREQACKRINELWGTNLHCVSVIDDLTPSMDANGTFNDEPEGEVTREVDTSISSYSDSDTT